ncbi:type 1 glutamine amidotransferase [Thalassobaculum sp.]|uniref:gamma-glutamyl-gamma-aminobutyrate hydrolase family protein n=1 Tax=Thalassobaculum sp. TaxID=2022740 RepID=UPI0032ECA657
MTTGRFKGRAMRLANSLGVLLGGGTPVTIGPGLRTDLTDLDGLIVGGGVDIESRLYGVDTTDEWPYDPDRDALEIRALDWAEQHDKPVLGICRGAQLLNVHRGGTLILDLDRARPDLRNPRSIFPCKTAHLLPSSSLAAMLGPGTLGINALHHQAVEKIGQDLAIAAVDSGGIVQAIEQTGHRFRVGVQWHPELLLWSTRHRQLFRALVAAAAAVPQRQVPEPASINA